MSNFDISTSGLLAPSQTEAQRIAGIVMPALKQAYENGVIDEPAIERVVLEAIGDPDGWGCVIKIHASPTPSGKKFGFRKESEFALERDIWDIYIDISRKNAS